MRSRMLEAAVLDAVLGHEPAGPQSAQLALMLQPIVDLATGGIACHEALLRVCVGEEVLSPGVVLPVVRGLGLAAMLDAQVIRLAASLTATHGPLAINLAAVASAMPVLARYKDYPLKVEISEHDPALSAGTLAMHLARLREMGFAVVLDDFGDGMVRHDHILDGLAGVKLDLRLTRLLADGGLAADALRAMLLRLKDAGLQVVAEGIESTTDLAAVQGVATHGQGYHLGRPAFP